MLSCLSFPLPISSSPVLSCPLLSSPVLSCSVLPYAIPHDAKAAAAAIVGLALCEQGSSTQGLGSVATARGSLATG